MKIPVKASFRDLTRFERLLWIVSLVVVSAAFLFSPAHDYLSLVASLIGVTALIFVAKGYVLGQLLSVVFAIFYGIVSFIFRYYGEVITYLCMTAPIAMMAVVSWMRHPYEDTAEVTVSSITPRQVARMSVLTVVVTVAFYFILGALGTANLLVSTFSVATSFLASYLTYLRSPYYGIGYASNDVVLIVLWVLASVEDPSYWPMVGCFVMFLVNDIYGFYNWIRIRRRQRQ